MVGLLRVQTDMGDIQAASSIDEVSRYWEWYIERIQVPGEPFASPRFFESIQAQHNHAYSCANELLGLPRLRGKSLLELGCGIGLDTVELARHDAEVTTIDVVPLALELAQTHLRYHNLRARVEFGNAETLRFEDNTFDLVLGRGILMFTPDDRRVLDEVLRVLKPGGQAQLLLHNRFSWYVLLAKISGTKLIHEERDPPINRLYSVREVRGMLGNFSSYQIRFGRMPSATNRGGMPAQVFNRVLVPLSRAVPDGILRRTGYYMIISATK